ncbi:MAG: TetR/AcrR family transcriptional regulator [Halobacillus sp.]|uniref:TetR/AcrR family transcriptional regulator n=1 Tax=Halobacillus sp. TaxID=56800 RepID=UPI003BB0C5A6
MRKLPRGFNKLEKQRIKETLQQEGRVLFSRFGLKKTSIMELAKASGISPGSFYSFYHSKEELFFEIVEQEEESIKKEFMSVDLSQAEDTKQTMKDLLLQTFQTIENNALLKNLLFDSNYESMVSKLPPEKLDSHFKKDAASVDLILTKWKQSGVIRPIDSDTLAGLLRALFTMSLHKKEIGEDVYPETIAMLIEFMVDGLVVKED